MCWVRLFLKSISLVWIARFFSMRSNERLLGRQPRSRRGTMVQRRLAILTAAFGAALLVASPSAAAPTVDDNVGTWTDLYTDSVGIVSAESPGIAHRAIDQLVTLADPEVPGQITTTVVQPTSFSAWGKVYVRYSAVTAQDVRVAFTADGGATYGPFTLQPSDDPAWHGMVDLSEVPASALAGRVSVQLASFIDAAEDLIITPTLQALRVTWTPQSVVKVALDALDSTCANEAVSYRLRVSASFVDTDKLVVYAPLAAASTGAFPQDNAMRFVSATEGGRHHGGAAPLTVDGVQVPPNSVYWRLGERPAGNTFVLFYAARPPHGTLNGTTYTAQAHGQATNSGPAESLEVVTSVRSSPKPFMNKTVSGAFRIFGEDYVKADSLITYTLVTGNYDFPPAKCGEAYFQSVVWDDLSTLVNPPGGGGKTFVGEPMNITGGGTYTATGTTVNGVTVPANAIYWDLGDLTVGQRFNLRFSLQLEDAPPLIDEQVLLNTAHIESGFSPAKASGSQTVIVGIPNDPIGIFAKGDKIRGSTSIRAGSNDNAGLTIGYGDPVTFLLFAKNGGASALNDIVMVDKIPAGTSFSSAFLPGAAGGAVHYHTGGADNAETDAPDFDPTSGALTGGWSTTLPADATSVTWVAVEVPKLASQFFPEDGVPTSVTGEVTVTVDPPIGDCPETTLVNTGNFYLYGSTDVDGTTITPQQVSAVDVEPVTVLPLVPSLAGTRINDSPATRVGTGSVEYTLVVVNRQPGGAETDTAFDVRAQIQLPSATVNGVDRFLSLSAIDAGGGSVDYAGLPSHLTVDYPTIGPGSSKVIRVSVHLPRGVVDGSTFGLNASVTGHDDICGDVTAAVSEQTVARVQPQLQVAKSVNLAVAAPGAEIEYTLTYANTGDGVATGTWLVDSVPVGARFVSIESPQAGGEAWFSETAPPTLPASLREGDEITDTLVRTNFSKGMTLPDGRIASPFGADTRWLAVLVDDTALSPPQLVTDGLRRIRFTAEIDPEAPQGTLVTNETAVFSNELLQAVSNLARTLISGNPSLEIAKACPDV
ncbi:MAG: putative repeat protein (TIGR01451 family), partial [Myxococcota bacterium]